MKTSAFVFLAAFMALSASWGGFVLAPQLQLGRGDLDKAANYPLARPGLARQGADVYRSLGCVHCHSQQIGQEKTVAEIVLTDAGTNTAATLAVLAKLSGEKGGVATTALPRVIMHISGTDVAGPALKQLATVGAKAEVRVSQEGPDIAQGWGRRATVAQDFLYDDTVQPGTRRIGPDLANIGLRKPDMNWHLRHLYAPRSEVTGSAMPPYRFLFEMRKITSRPSPDALQLTGEFAPKAGFEVVPKEEARALAAYLANLHADVPLFETPFTPPVVAAPATNAPAQ